MIRQYSESDLAAIIAMVQQDRHMKATEIEERLKDSTVWVWDDGAMLGCSAVGKVRETPKGKVVSAWAFTAKPHRGQGIGKQLWQPVSEHIRGLDVVRVHTTYRSDRGNGRVFYAGLGFEQWFSSHLMKYEGPDFGETGLKPIPYSDELFPEFVRLTNDGFRDLRRQCNIEPADCYPDGFDEAKARETALKQKDDIFLFFEDGKAFAYTQLETDYIDTITVGETHRGKGLGRKLTQFSVNLLRQRGAGTVYLGVLDVNKIARGLYESLGFEFEETTEFARSKVGDRS